MVFSIKHLSPVGDSFLASVRSSDVMFGTRRLVRVGGEVAPALAFVEGEGT